MNDDFVSFDLAKKLKDKGFNQPCLAHYTNGKFEYNCDNSSFLSVLILDGKGSITVDNTAISVKKGDSIFIPANSGNVVLSGEFDALLSTL
jgi:mannose-6-phosphate isomerase